MEKIQEQITRLKVTWGKIYENAQTAEAAWRPYLQFADIDQVDDIINLIVNLLERVRAPSGFSPGFHIAKGIAASLLPTLNQSALNLQSGQYNHFPQFLIGLNNLLNALNNMLIFSSINVDEDLKKQIEPQLLEAIQLLRSAKAEIDGQINELQESFDIANSIEQKYQSIIEIEKNVEEINQKISSALEHASDNAEEIEDIKQSIQNHLEQIKTLTKRNQELQNEFAKNLDILKELQEKSIAQQKIIDSLLPKGASAGLAAAFASRESQLQKTKWIWMGVFIFSILSLAGFSVFLAITHPPDSQNFWEYILYKIPLAAPFIWLGWYSAIQYGYIVRIQEDYAFKEATSKAFAGYRDHIEHLASVNLDEAYSAMNLLAAKTIEILSHEPLRIFNKTDKDVTPTHNIVELIKSWRSVKPTKEKNEDV